MEDNKYKQKKMLRKCRINLLVNEQSNKML